MKRFLVILPLVGVLIVAAAIVLPCIFGNVDGDMREPRTRADLGAIATVFTQFHRKYHRYPNEQEGIATAAALMLKNEHSIQRLQFDRWDRPYAYRLGTDGIPRVYSYGANGRDDHGKGDDILMPALSP